MRAFRPVLHSLLRSAPLLAAAVLGLSGSGLHAQQAPPTRLIPHNFQKWERDIAAFERQDRLTPPPSEPVLFVGSSTVVRWRTLAQDFPDCEVLNRAFGGNEIADTTYYADRIIFPYKPKMIVLRAGNNDIHAGRSPEEVMGDFKDFVAKVRGRLPHVPIAFVAVNPTPLRWNERQAGDRLNALIAAYTKTEQDLIFIDISRLSLHPNGQVRPELFEADRLHFNQEGYKLLASVVRPHLVD